MLRLTPDQKEDLGEFVFLYGLEDLYHWVIEHSSATAHPFHNRYLTDSTLLHCHHAARVDSLDLRAEKCLLLAALFQYGNHSGGRLGSNEESTAALGLLDEARRAGLVSPDKQGAVAALLTTSGPLPEELEVAGGILADTRLMPMLAPCWFEHVMVGWRLEQEPHHGRQSLATFCDQLEAQLAGAVFRSRWGQTQEKVFHATVKARLATARAVAAVTEQLALDALAAYEVTTGLPI